MKPFSRAPGCGKKFSPGSHEASGLPKHCHRPPGIRNLYRRVSWYGRKIPLDLFSLTIKQKLVQDLLEVRFLLEPSIAAMAATRADEKDIKKITTLCDEVETLLKNHEDHTQKDIDFHTAIALSSKNVVVPRLIPVINSSIPLFVETTGGILRMETIESHREIADADCLPRSAPRTGCHVSPSCL